MTSDDYDALKEAIHGLEVRIVKLETFLKVGTFLVTMIQLVTQVVPLFRR